MCAWLVESFPPEIRLTSVAVGYNIAQAIVGGSSPALATYLVDTHGQSSPGYMVSVLAIFSLSGLALRTFCHSDKYEDTSSGDFPWKDRKASNDKGLFDYDSDDERDVSNLDMELI